MPLNIMGYNFDMFIPNEVVLLGVVLSLKVRWIKVSSGPKVL